MALKRPGGTLRVRLSISATSEMLISGRRAAMAGVRKARPAGSMPKVSRVRMVPSGCFQSMRP